ncbi:hypothetical protein [Pelosinus sp. sgz500959]|uniref:hypothetical protein n=1 Tax=Pelosinus sp. sgz500959 TaxID=3242472 RepID=UPI0036706291
MIKKLNFIQTPYEYDCGRLHLLIKANTETKTIHVLDFFSPTSLLNCREVVQPNILAQLHFEEEPLEWNWLWYSSSNKLFLSPVGSEGPGNLVDCNHKAIDHEALSMIQKLNDMELWENP